MSNEYKTSGSSCVVLMVMMILLSEQGNTLKHIGASYVAVSGSRLKAKIGRFTCGTLVGIGWW